MARPKPTTGYLAPIALAAGIGLLVCSLANTLAREGGDPSLLYWAGILVIALPIFWRLTSRDASTSERLVLVCMLGFSLYVVKVVRDAPLFTFSDELVHAFNADQIANHHHLFRLNPILPVTPNYPGLEGATSALMSLTGLSSYGAGIVIVGAARLSMMIGLFLLFVRIGGSARTAGLAAAIYAGNFNFFFWGAQFSYESIALPLFVVVLMAVAERDASPREWARDWAVPIVLGIAAIVVTHHLTSYAVAGFLALWRSSTGRCGATGSWPNPWRYAILAAVLAIGWLVLVASSTFGYLGPVIGEAFEAIFNTASGDAPPRGLFQGKGSSIPDTPILARGIALLAVALLGLGVLFGLKRFWQRHRKEPYPLIFAAASIVFFGTLSAAPCPRRLGDRQPAQRVPLRRPRLHRRPLRPAELAAGQAALGRARGAYRGAGRGPGRRRDRGLALGPAALRADPRQRRGAHDLLRTAGLGRVGGAQHSRGRAFRRQHRRRPHADGARRTSGLCRQDSRHPGHPRGDLLLGLGAAAAARRRHPLRGHRSP